MQPHLQPRGGKSNRLTCYWKVSTRQLGHTALKTDTRGIKGTDTIRSIFRNYVPTGGHVTYAIFVCDLKPLKAEKHRVRITVGGDRLFLGKTRDLQQWTCSKRNSSSTPPYQTHILAHASCPPICKTSFWCCRICCRSRNCWCVS